MKYRGGWLLFLPRATRYMLRKLGIMTATFVGRISLKSVGKNSRIQWGVYFMQPSVVTIGKNCLIWSGVRFSADYPDAHVTIGNGVQINSGVNIDTTGGVIIEDNVLISEGAVIYTHDHGLDPHSVPVPGEKRIGESAWIGMRAIILPGCTYIGKNSVVGAGSVVTRNVPDNTVVAGNPARTIRVRPS